MTRPITALNSAAIASPGGRPTHPGVLAWVDEMARLCRPDHIHWCDGTDVERAALTALAVVQGVLTPLDAKNWPGCYLNRSHPDDVARVEDRTFICSPSEDDAGPTNHWAEPAAMRRKLFALAEGGMAGRTMYVVPYLMGPPGSPVAKVGVELTDSIYVALSMRIMTRMGAIAWAQLGPDGDFNRGLHLMLKLDTADRYIAHFPADNAVISLNSNYGGNVLLGKKCLALRIASTYARREGWLAEHMLIAGIEDPQGRKTYIAAAFPSACGKTNLAMLVPPAHFKGWKVWTVGDDIAWMRPEKDGRLYAINPEHGYFGVAPGTSDQSNPNAMATVRRDTIFTNVAHTPDNGVWWEGMGPPPAACTDWKGNPWQPGSPTPAAQANSRFASPMANNPWLSPEADNPHGVPISAIIFGARRATTFPLVFQAFNWSHGTYLGATMGSETTAAATGVLGQVRRDPMAMLPFCGYHIGDYFGHWLEVGRKLSRPPRIFHVNWFGKDAAGKFLWPGFGENMRIIKWITDRCQGQAHANETAIGWMPDPADIDIDGLPGYSRERLAQALDIDRDAWHRELGLQQAFFDGIGAKLPRGLELERQLAAARLG
jgi:phosphoenolpyruvate carboxykinase (GTP)